jgi:hypothetical protein
MRWAGTVPLVEAQEPMDVLRCFRILQVFHVNLFVDLGHLLCFLLLQQTENLDLGSVSPELEGVLQSDVIPVIQGDFVALNYFLERVEFYFTRS